MLSCKRSFCILDDNPLSNMWYTAIFLVCNLSFHPLNQGLSQNKSIYFDKAKFITISFYGLSFWRHIWQAFTRHGSGKFSNFFSKVVYCYASHLSLRPILSLFLCEGVRFRLKFFFFFFLNGSSVAFSDMLLHPCYESVEHIRVGLFLGSLVCSIILCLLLC